jgi:hypothetical protein
MVPLLLSLPARHFNAAKQQQSSPETLFSPILPLLASFLTSKLSRFLASAVRTFCVSFFDFVLWLSGFVFFYQLS